MLFDQAVMVRNIKRALKAGQLPCFLDEIATDELADKFASITRSFSSIAIFAHDSSRLERAIAQSASANAAISRHSPLALLDDLALPEGGHDCLLVACGLEWTNDLPGKLAQLRRTLKPDGVLLAAMLGGDTLCELRAAWLHAETTLTSGASPRVAPFCDVRDAGSLLQRAGFALPVVDTDRFTVRHQNGLALMKDLKSLGLSNAMHERSRRLTFPDLLVAACAAYDHANADPDGRVRATFQLIYLTGWAPDESQPKPLRPGSAKTRLADALNVREVRLPKRG